MDLTPENYLGNREKNRMAKELIFDIESNLNDWVCWDYMDNDAEETAVRRETLRTKIEKLKKLIKQYDLARCVTEQSLLSVVGHTKAETAAETIGADLEAEEEKDYG